MKFGFYSCMSGIAWGGSEELWWRTARCLQGRGHQVAVSYKWWSEPARQLKELMDNGGQVFWRETPPLSFWPRQWGRVRSWFGNGAYTRNWLQAAQPDAVLITLGYHPDRIYVADECRRMGIPYAINVQSASHFFFIHGDLVPQYRNWYQGAERVYFVSRENQDKLETNLAVRLDNAEIVDNPFNIDPHLVVDWPPTEPNWRLACVGRVHFQSKGQDLILEVMQRPHWRERNLEILFFGKDQGNALQLKELITLHGLHEKLKFVGFDEDMSDVWKQCHGLILPSRYEGAALV
ncbi:MAG TPA: glycosyltransferase family 4 protein, partial [Pirellulaceae bacterium]|nr:glycosyltransferase family 4 protein [Pirellulaceae bacterium]